MEHPFPVICFLPAGRCRMALFGSRNSFRRSPGEASQAWQELLGEVKQEKAELEVLLERARSAAKSMGRVDKQIVDVSRRQDEIATSIDAIGSRAQALADLAAEIEQARARVGQLGAEQGQAGDDATRLRAELGEMAGGGAGQRTAP